MYARSRQLVGGVAALGMLLFAGSVVAPSGDAAPPNPPNCEQAGRVMFCDGPVGADNSWERCETFHNFGVVIAPGAFAPSFRRCTQVTQGALPDGSPQHHIG